MEEFLGRTLDQLLGRMGGPFHLRFVLQPLMASLLAIRAGLRDAREHRQPYLWAIFYDRNGRRSLLLSGWKDVGKVCIVAFVLDACYQSIVLHWLYPGQALIVAFVLAVVPYLVVRGPAARIAGRRLARRPQS